MKKIKLLSMSAILAALTFSTFAYADVKCNQINKFMTGTYSGLVIHFTGMMLVAVNINSISSWFGLKGVCKVSGMASWGDAANIPIEGSYNIQANDFVLKAKDTTTNSSLKFASSFAANEFVIQKGTINGSIIVKGTLNKY